MTTWRDILNKPHVREAYNQYAHCLDRSIEEDGKSPETCVNELKEFNLTIDELDVVLAKRSLDEELTATAWYESRFEAVTDAGLKAVVKHNWWDEKSDHAVKLQKWLGGGSSMHFKVIGRHRWVPGAIITETIDEATNTRRFTATIRGFQNWKLYEGQPYSGDAQDIIKKVKEIRDKIDSGDKTIFEEQTLIKPSEADMQ